MTKNRVWLLIALGSNYYSGIRSLIALTQKFHIYYELCIHHKDIARMVMCLLSSSRVKELTLYYANEGTTKFISWSSPQKVTTSHWNLEINKRIFLRTIFACFNQLFSSERKRNNNSWRIIKWPVRVWETGYCHLLLPILEYYMW